jgi:hypothetical protein
MFMLSPSATAFGRHTRYLLAPVRSASAGSRSGHLGTGETGPPPPLGLVCGAKKILGVTRKHRIGPRQPGNVLCIREERRDTTGIVAGSCAEYDWSVGECKENRTPLLPGTLYGTSKHALERILHAWSRQVDLSSAWGRIFFPLWPARASFATGGIRGAFSVAGRGGPLL